MHVAACFRLVSPLEIQEQEEQEEQKGCLMVMADPSDFGHGKKEQLPIFSVEIFLNFAGIISFVQRPTGPKKRGAKKTVILGDSHSLVSLGTGRYFP